MPVCPQWAVAPSQKAPEIDRIGGALGPLSLIAKACVELFSGVRNSSVVITLRW